MKIYAKQVNPEYQESPLFNDSCFPSNIAVFGNRDYREHIPEAISHVLETLKSGELSYEIDRAGSECAWYKNATEAINDLLPRENGKRYGTRAIHELKTLVDEWNTCDSSDEPRVLCCVLDIVTGKEWDWNEIHGCCQGEWNRVYFPANDWDSAALEAFEFEYFNNGIELIVHDEHGAPESVDDISGYSFYAHCYSIDDAKDEIARFHGVSVDDVVLYEYAE